MASVRAAVVCMRQEHRRAQQAAANAGNMRLLMEAEMAYRVMSLRRQYPTLITDTHVSNHP